MGRGYGRACQNRAVAKQRSDDEQKAVETILWALGHRLLRIRDEHAMAEMRGDEIDGVSKGLDLALREVNELLPRRRRIRSPASTCIQFAAPASGQRREN